MIKVKRFTTVTDSEVQLLESKPRHANFIKYVLTPLKNEFLKEDEDIIITSIDTNAVTGLPRMEEATTQTHYKSNACDYSFGKYVGTDFQVNLPTPLNRNLLLVRLIKALIKQSGLPISAFPLIALESDHIHTDVIRTGAFIIYNEVRATFDKNAALAKKIPGLNDKSYERIL